jgi:hypothetical protein
MGKPNCCYRNVMSATRSNGGVAVFGWVKDGAGVITALYAHVCWRKPDGELVCITPYSTEVPDEIDFFPDDTVKDEWERTGFQPVKISTPDPTLTAYIRRSEEAYIKGHFARGDYWTEKANEIAHRHGAHLNTRSRTDGHLSSIYISDGHIG